MFTRWRFLQIGMLAFAISACAAPQSRPAPGPSTKTPAASPPVVEKPASSRIDGDLNAYVQSLATERNLPAEQLNTILQSAQYNPTVAKLIAPAAAGKKVVRSWTVYRKRVVEPVRIRWGVEFMNANQATLDQASQRFGVPAEIIVAIIGVETNYARNMGSFSVLDALYTLAFRYPDPSRPDRQEMFRNQLSDFLSLVMTGKLDVGTQGSYAGAIGMSQFMPGSIERYAVDGDGDGIIDLTNSTRDAILSVGNFLAAHGWQRGLPVFAPVTLPSDPSALVDGGLEPHLDWSQMQTAGARASADASTPWTRHRMGVINLPDDQYGTVQYRTGTPNFFALTHYNRSYFYATSVADLASELKTRQ
ncbi:MAG: lytic murein transglycosylase B [Burkholderiaceae bacterium]